MSAAGLGSRSGAGLRRDARRALWILIGAGVAIRVALAFSTYGLRYDIDSQQLVADALSRHPGRAYAGLRWPYPAGFFALLWPLHSLAYRTGLPFHGLVQLPSIAADAGLSWLVALSLGRRGASDARRLGGAALVALGPSFVLISGYHGQIDPLAMVLALAAVLVWERGGAHRTLYAGLLLGAGASVKTVPAFLVLALLPSVRSRREGALILGLTALVPVLTTLPFALTDPHDTLLALRSNHGVPGVGGLSVVVQPGLPGAVIRHEAMLSALNTLLTRHQNALVALAVLAAGALAAVRRLEPMRAAVLIWLVVEVVNPNFVFQYVIWALPFALAAGHLRAGAVAQLALLVPAAIGYAHLIGRPVGAIFVPASILIWIALAVTLAVLVARIARAPADGGPTAAGVPP